MQIGFNLPINGPLFPPDILTRIAQKGEEIGYDYLTLTDHIVLPNLRVPGYPYSESGDFLDKTRSAGTSCSPRQLSSQRRPNASASCWRCSWSRTGQRYPPKKCCRRSMCFRAAGSS
jgi:hypothetical protein